MSDKSLKTNVNPVGSVLSKIMQLVPLEYHYIHNEKMILYPLFKDVEQFFPNLVSKESNEKLFGIDYSKFAVISIKAIQEQQEIIDQMHNRLII